MNYTTRGSSPSGNLRCIPRTHIPADTLSYDTSTSVGGKSVRQANASGGTHFPRKFCPTGQDILSYRTGYTVLMCPGLGGKSVRQENVFRPDPIIGLA